MVPEVGFEPTRCCHRGILSPLRLPFRHSGAAGILALRKLLSTKDLRRFVSCHKGFQPKRGLKNAPQRSIIEA